MGLNDDVAKVTHDAYHAGSNEMLKSVIAFGVEAIRTAAFFNGGATVASIALVGSIFTKNDALAISFSDVIFYFAVGTLAAGAASCFAYVSQFLYHLQYEKFTLSYEHPYVHPPKGWKIANGIGAFTHILCVLSILVSYASLIWGALCIGWLMKGQPIPSLW